MTELYDECVQRRYADETTQKALFWLQTTKQCCSAKGGKPVININVSVPFSISAIPSGVQFAHWVVLRDLLD